eukprot:9481750-Karenia_brevis.AAC.1
MSGICPACGTNFFCRERVLSHVSETRTRNKSGLPTCRQKLLAGLYPALDADTLEQATLSSRKALREARQKGHTHIIATQPAKRKAVAAKSSVQNGARNE